MKTLPALYRLPARDSSFGTVPECLFAANTDEEALEAERRGGSDVSGNAAEWAVYEAQQAGRDPAFFEIPLRGKVPRPPMGDIERLHYLADHMLHDLAVVEGLTYGALRGMLGALSRVHRALVTVDGGVTMAYADPGVLVEVFDPGKGGQRAVPGHFAGLADGEESVRARPDARTPGQDEESRLIERLRSCAGRPQPDDAPLNVSYGALRALSDRFSRTHRVLVIVNDDGVVRVIPDPAMQVEVFDWDNYRAGTHPGVPESFADLAAQAGGVPVRRPAPSGNEPASPGD